MTHPHPQSPTPATTPTTPAPAKTASRGTETPAETAFDYPGRYRLLTKQDVCAVYDISVRCLENWIKKGRVPAPVQIEGRRYWHPERFFAELSAKVGAQPPASGPDVAASAEPAIVSQRVV